MIGRATECRDADPAHSAYLITMPKASYLTKTALAAELMISESTVDEYVRRGLLPPPIRISPSCVRWRWATVDEILQSAEIPRWSTDNASSEERAGQVIDASQRLTLQDRANAELYARAVAASRRSETVGQSIDPGAARVIAASKERLRSRRKGR